MNSFNSSKPKFEQKQLRQADKVEDVVNYGLWHLSKRDHSIYELKTKMKKKTDNDEWIEQAIEKLIELRYLDDQRYVNNFLQNSNEFKKHGPMRIKQELRLKGIDKELIFSSMAESEFDYFESALEYLNKKYSYKIEDRKEKDRITRFFISRGFSFDMIKYAFEAHLTEED